MFAYCELDMNLIYFSSCQEHHNFFTNYSCMDLKIPPVNLTIEDQEATFKSDWTVQYMMGGAPEQLHWNS